MAMLDILLEAVPGRDRTFPCRRYTCITGSGERRQIRDAALVEAGLQRAGRIPAKVLPL